MKTSQGAATSAGVHLPPSLNSLDSTGGGLVVPEVDAEGFGCNPEPGSEDLVGMEVFLVFHYNP